MQRVAAIVLAHWFFIIDTGLKNRWRSIDVVMKETHSPSDVDVAFIRPPRFYP